MTQQSEEALDAVKRERAKYFKAGEGTLRQLRKAEVKTHSARYRSSEETEIFAVMRIKKVGEDKKEGHLVITCHQRERNL